MPTDSDSASTLPRSSSEQKHPTWTEDRPALLIEYVVGARADFTGSLTFLASLGRKSLYPAQEGEVILSEDDQNLAGF
jgi:hypothetical protein